MKHWKTQAELAELRPEKARRRRLRAAGPTDRWARIDSFEQARPPRLQTDWSGALVGLALVAAACTGLCLMLYQVSGPRDTFADGEGPID